MLWRKITMVIPVVAKAGVKRQSINQAINQFDI
jgi:hypothetical protein